MVLDEPGPLDTTVEAAGLTFVLAQDLAELALPLTIDAGPYGLNVTSEKLTPSSCG